MCLREDVLCVLSKFRKKTALQAAIEAMECSRHTVTEARVIEVLHELVISKEVREFTDDGRRGSRAADIRLLCTPATYHQFQLTRLGEDNRKILMSRKQYERERLMRRHVG